jgi:hypothetical protein
MRNWTIPTRERDHQVPADGRGFPVHNLVNLTSGIAVTVEIKWVSFWSSQVNFYPPPGRFVNFTRLAR